MTSEPDATIIAASQDDPDRFGEVVHRHHAVVYRYIARRLGTGSAEDLAAETFTTAFATRARYDTTHPSARPWLLGIATNLVRNHNRREAAALRAYARTGEDPVDPTDTGEAVFGPAVAAAMAALRPRHRDVLFLHAVAELSHDEIAVAMGVPVGTVKGWLSRARAKAQRELADHGVAPSASTPTQVLEP